MGARYYNPDIGRFITRDSYRGDVYKPWTRNLYTYCNNNPVNYVDPTGHCHEAAAQDEYYNPDTDVSNYAKLLYFFKPNEVDVAFFQAGGPYGPETGAAGYVIGRIVGKEAAEKILGKILTGTEKNVLKIETHHLLPKQFRDKFEKVGLNIDDYTIEMLQDAHRLKPDGIHTGTENWNKQWKEFFDEHPKAEKEEILDHLEVLKKKYGIE